MASTELLASKVVILEEEPQIPAIVSLPSAVCLAVGITERGPIADPVLLTSFEEYVKTFGGFTLNAEVALAAHGYFYNGGSFLWVARTCHFTDVTDPATAEAVAGTLMLDTLGGADSPAEVTSTLASPYALVPGDTLVAEITGGGDQTATFTATAAQASLPGPAGYPIAALTLGDNMTIAIDGGAPQTITAAGGETTALDIVNLINAQLVGGRAYVSGPLVLVESDLLGAAAIVDFAAGAPDMLAQLGGTPGPVAGGGNVQNILSVTGLEVKTIVELAVAGSVVTVNGNGTVTLATVAVGAAETIAVKAASTADTKMGIDNVLHTGGTAAPQATLKVDGKTKGAYSDNVRTVIEAATNGDSDFFNLTVTVSGAIKEVWPNVTMDSSNPGYVENRINDLNLGSDLIAVTDQSATGTIEERKPVSGTFGPLVGGDDGIVGIASNDYIGSAAGGTGLYAFDLVGSGRILIVPAQTSAAVHLAMMDYAESWRNGSMIAVLDCPQSQTAQQIVSYVQLNGLLEYSEFGVIYWPWIKVVNPSTATFGDDDKITVAPSGWIAGKYASNDQRLGGVYESPAGIGEGFGIIRGMVGVEDDPTGRDRHSVLDERVRDLVYPYRINPITKLESTPWHIDGGRTLKSTGNFPNVGERRGVIFIEQTLKQGLVILKHRFNNRTNRQRAKRIIKAFLVREMNKGAFRSTNPETAFYVDASDQLNPPAQEFAGIMTIRIGLATNKPSEFIVIIITQDTRALAESLAA